MRGKGFMHRSLESHRMKVVAENVAFRLESALDAASNSAI